MNALLNATQAGTVEVRNNNQLLGTATVRADGTWRFEASNLSTGLHAFTATFDTTVSAPYSIIVATEQFDLAAPHFQNSTSVGPDREQVDYYSHEGDGFVDIPDYNMKAGDTVRVSWIGRDVTVDSEIQTVANPPQPLTFKISQYEIIDVIGNNATIKYTVKRPPDDTIHTSNALTLTVLGNAFTVNAPTINSTHDNLRVWFQSQFQGSSTARVRAIGIDTWQSDVEYFNGENIDFRIDPTWILRNRGRNVLFNWSLKLNSTSDTLYYSQILRLNAL